jgi:hypothetical protein
MRPTQTVAPEDSLQRATLELRRNGGDLLPVAIDGALVGILTENSLAVAFAHGSDLRDPVSEAMRPAATVAPYASGAEALRKLTEPEVSALVVVDDHRQVLGVVAATDLVPRRRVLPRPAMVGGMATPFGVYLTNGVVSGGAGGLALVCTGAVMFFLLFAAQILVQYAMPAIVSLGLPPAWGDWAQSATTPVLFLVAMRIIPLSGTHAAEHQVVHAIERGEDLLPDVVRRMPRVHPRCGTNLAAAATIFLSIFLTEWIPYTEVRLLVAFFVTVTLWRRVGALLQEFVTTRPATDRQLASGIKAGTELLDRFARSRVTSPSAFQRIWNSGILHVVMGSSIMAGLVYLVGQVLNLPVPI